MHLQERKYLLVNLDIILNKHRHFRLKLLQMPYHRREIMNPGDNSILSFEDTILLLLINLSDHLVVLFTD